MTRGADGVGVVDPIASTFATIAVPTGATTSGRYSGAVAVGDAVFMAPHNEDFVAVLNVSTGVVSTIATPGVVTDSKYSGAIAVDSLVYFVPHDVDNAGHVDANTLAFSTISTVASAVTGNQKYRGGTAWGMKIYFAPHRQNNIGVVDVTTNVFSTIDISAANLASVSQKYYGAAAVNGAIYFAPCSAHGVGKLDVASEVFTTIPTGQTATWKYSGVVTVESMLYFIPSSVQNVGVLDATSDAFSTVATTSPGGGGVFKFQDGALVETLYPDTVGSTAVTRVVPRIFMAPYNEMDVGMMTVCDTKRIISVNFGNLASSIGAVGGSGRAFGVAAEQSTTAHWANVISWTAHLSPVTLGSFAGVGVTLFGR